MPGINPPVENAMRCSFKTNNEFTGYLLQLLRRHFMTPETLMMQSLQSYPWSANKQNTKIWIDTPSKENMTNIQQRPFIGVKRGQSQYILSQKNGLASTANGTQVFDRHVEVPYAIICIGGNSMHVEDLLAEVDIFFTSNSVLICKDAGLLKFIPIGISTVSVLKEHEDNYIGTLQLQIGYGQSIRIQLESLPIREVKQEVNLG